MNLSLFIARRYLFSKKSTNAINVISLISVVGVAIATAALVIVLSAFNGFQDLVASFFTACDSELKVVPTQGKTVAADTPVLTAVKQLPEVAVATECVEDMAMAWYQDRQTMVTVKGVEDNFQQQTAIDSILYGAGEFRLHAANLQFGIPGVRLAQTLGMGTHWNGFLRIYAPEREGQLADVDNPNEAFVVDSLFSPGVVFIVNQSKYDQNYLLTHISFARELFGQQGMVSSLELRLKDGADVGRVKTKIARMCGDRFRVMDRYEQQEDTFRIMQIEKLFAFFFLTFILAVACFNIIGSLSMLVIEKKDDVHTLRSMGADDRLVRRIFLLEGRMITAVGAIVGIAIGLVCCWVQIRWGVVPLGDSSGTFVVDAYPISVKWTDLLLILAAVTLVGWIAVWYPVRYMSRRLLS